VVGQVKGRVGITILVQFQRYAAIGAVVYALYFCAL